MHGLGADAREYLEAAALLANVGLSISHSKHHKHSYYVIRNSDRLVGLTDHEIELIAQIARYHRKSGPKPSHPEWAALDPDDQELVRACAAVLRVAIGLDRGHESRIRSVGADVRTGRRGGDRRSPPGTTTPSSSATRPVSAPGCWRRWPAGRWRSSIAPGVRRPPTPPAALSDTPRRDRRYHRQWR